ncbi:1-3-beta-glucanosyltransferase gel2 [Penicillium macrosclerotiorum]|uniref:1-3-beta-glucanosyltransferase gel2 n=1 Tax=Penicillium macrosclerotiorum TaxID=303699 RepID=UPI002549229B|nr:1-3-beta-glucanosyltransferase gel2 [Penicillium macrosclerotiorum]KAJ5690854.1 1-3-beta-glucanosyltransferase gel2 [Penicillium macrosclerotiorum]
MFASYGRLLTAICALAGSAAAVTPLKVQGKDFVNTKTGDRFQIIGVDYQPGGSSGFSKKADPLSDPDVCLRDAALMQRLGINTIRVYNLEPSLDHNKCASIFNAAGIYMILDVNSPLANGALDRTAPWTTYTPAYYQQVFGVIEAFKEFPNILGFFAGNEVINEDATRLAPAYVRAVVRDMKDYIAKNADRTIPVGYSAADVRDILMDTAHYFECELKNSTSSRADFFGLNSYSWCGKATYTSSGYDVLTDDFSNATLPVFFSEYGCNDVKPRVFTEVQALYGEEMTQAFSGGLVYEWTQEANEYGLIKSNSNGTVTTLIDYDNLLSQFSKLDMDRISSSNTSQTSVDPETCSPSLITSSDFYNAWNLPEAPSKVSDYIKNGLPASIKPSGSLVSVTATTLSEKVYDYTGKEITNVQFKVLSNDESNSPSSTGTGTSSSSSSSSSGTSTSTNAASSLNGAPSIALGGLSGVFMLLASLL